jgi:hypothetical protein
MIERAAQADRPNWRLPAYVAIVELAVLIFVALFNTDTQLLLFLLFVGPALLLASIILIFLLFRAAIGHARQFLPLLATLAVLWVIPTSLVFYERSRPYEIRDTARWLVLSHHYKQIVLAQPQSASGGLKHIEWDATGFVGVANNTNYLVFDPADTLSTATKRHRPGKFTGIPCEVRYVRRLESHWYAVFFYTDENWNGCS